MLYSAPSFCIYTSEDGFEEEIEKGEVGERTEEIIGSGEFSFVKKNMDLIEEQQEGEGEGEEEKEVSNRFQDLGLEEVVKPASPPMYLATGLGVGGNGSSDGGGGGVFSPAYLEGGGNVEEYYKKMVVEDPSNPVFLRSYAQLLQSKGDLHGAEEYFFRATLADPNDGEIWLSLAKLVWELHQDQDRALNYIELAARAAPNDSHILAAYACFLWEIEEDKDENSARIDYTPIEENTDLVEVQKSAYGGETNQVSSSLHLPAGLGIDAAGISGIDNDEEYYKRMVEENPCSPLFLRNYAQFLYQTKGDLQGAEKYYSRAILADPANGEIISQYAMLVWELHRDQVKALAYFERAVQAMPEDSHVLAAYASFLWETGEDEEEDGAVHDHIQAPLFPAAMT